jgi:DNA-binding MarR family transcriptional regulator
MQESKHPTAAAADAEPDAVEGARAAELAASAWVSMSEFVRGFDPTEELRRTLALGRGSGRVKTLLGLADGPLSVAELARSVGADAPYTTLIVNELQALGLVTRASDERDRRRKMVTLTARGREAVRTAQGIIGRPPAALHALAVEELADLCRILERLTALCQETSRASSASP